MEISEHLHVSYSTVKTHVSHLLSKLEVRDRAQLVVLGLPQRAGQLTTDMTTSVEGDGLVIGSSR